MGSEAQEERDAQRKRKEERRAKDFMRGFYQNPSSLSGETARPARGSAVEAQAYETISSMQSNTVQKPALRLCLRLRSARNHGKYCFRIISASLFPRSRAWSR